MAVIYLCVLVTLLQPCHQRKPQLTHPNFHCKLIALRWGVAPEPGSGLAVVMTERDFPAAWKKAQDHRLSGGGLFIFPPLPA